MKIRVILFSSLMLLGSLNIYSQAKFAFGVKGGVNFATLEGENAQAVYDSRTGYHIGLFTSVKASRLGIQPEVNYSSQGSEITIGPLNYTHKIDYVLVPVVLKFYLFDWLNLQAGPQFGILTSSKQINGGNTVTLTDTYKQSDLSIATGIGLELPLGINLEGRYNIGVSDVNDNPLIQSQLENQVYQISIGFRFIDAGKD